MPIFSAGWLLVTDAHATSVIEGDSWQATGGHASASLGTSVASAGDVDGDGYDDLIVGGNGEARVYLGSAIGVSSTSAWSATGGSDFGHAVASAGDVNGDGYDDVVVGAYNYNRYGKASVFLGSPTGPETTPSWTGVGTYFDGYFAWSVASAGDVNGDGYDDLVVGAPHEDTHGHGRAWLFLGSATGLSATPDWAGEEGNDGDYGMSVAGAGDVDGDGFDDVIVGRPLGAVSFFGQGGAYVYLGTAIGLSPVAAWIAWGPVDNARFGASVASAGDVNGDGFDDVVVGAWNQTVTGVASVFLGSATGLSSTANRTWLGSVAGGDFGAAVAGAGDVDGDGFDDVLVAAPDGDRVDLFRGSSTGPSAVADATFVADVGSDLGSSVAGAGDLDGDGIDDLVIGEPNGGEADEGIAHAYLDLFAESDGDGLLDVNDHCPHAFDPTNVDTDGDGVGDACDAPLLSLVGLLPFSGNATLIASGVLPGEVVRFAGGPGAGSPGPCPAALGGLCLDLGPQAVDLGAATAGPSGVATLALTVPATVRPEGIYGLQAIVRRGAGGATSVKSDRVEVDGPTLDWDGDGITTWTELLLGTDPAVADTDGDGLLDGEELVPHLDPLSTDSDGDGVIDSADDCFAGDDADDPDNDGVPTACDNCPRNRNATQADTDHDGLGDGCEGNVLVAGWSALGTQAGAWFGRSVGPAGDVDGDGYDDVLVGAPGFDASAVNEGAAALYRGRAAGLAASPVWTTTGGQAGAELGEVVSAGDVDGDGFDDVLITAARYDGGQGRVWLHLGASVGLSAVPTWEMAGDEPHAAFGSSAVAADLDGDGFSDVVIAASGSSDGLADVFMGSPLGLPATPTFQVDGRLVARAGDVDGDGFDDLLVGAAGNGAQDDGAALYLGSATGPSLTPDWTASGDPGGWFGYAIASAGDVNGDGFDDVVVGAPEEDHPSVDAGAVHVFFGSSLGLSATPDWSATGRLPNDGFGWSVSSAGDVDGDGYDDLLVGANGASNGQWMEGTASLFLGSADGLARSPTWTAEGQEAHAGFGSRVAGAGDTDGDGHADVIVGAWAKDQGLTDQGAAYVYVGRSR
ncbi:MAG: FG-GAP repeat protein [Alphaproteobacteria bacterium]|nr:FG-GAP repeat protein [Alphaproteobacteria bacterium]MCB9699890.1 FG-GAP repeat protein [Alphaproteobacteria bacterium]